MKLVPKDMNPRPGKKRRILPFLLAGLLCILAVIGIAVPFQSGADLTSGGENVAVVLSEPDHGTLRTSGPEVPRGSLVRIEAVPDDGYYVDAVTAVDGGGTVLDLPLSLESDYSCTATLEAETSVTVTATFTDKRPDGNATALAVLNPQKAERSDRETGTDYIAAHMDPAYVGSGRTLEAQDVIHVTTTVLDSGACPEPTFDGLWRDEDGDGYSEYGDAVLNQGYVYIPLYSSGEDGDYFVGLAGAALDGGTVTDWAAGQNDATGHVLSDIVYDDATGLVYVPKAYRPTVDGVAQVLRTRLQLLVAADEPGAATASFPVSFTGTDGSPDARLVHGSLLSVGTDLRVQGISGDRIRSVTVNGIRYEDDEQVWDYDGAEEVLRLYVSPASLTDVAVELDDAGADPLVVEAKAATVSGTMVFDRMPEVGDDFVVSVNAGYTSAMKGIPGYEYACVPVEVGTQTVGTVDQTACQYALGNVPFTVGTWDTDAWMDSRNIPWSGIYINRPVQVREQTVGGVQVPAMNLNLLCTHLKMGVGGDPNNSGDPDDDRWSDEYGLDLHANLHVTAIQGDYLIVGVYTSTVRTQSGAGFFRIPFRVDGGKVRVRKAPEATAYADCIQGNPAYSLSGATYGLYRDVGCTDLIQTLVTQNGEGLTPYSEALPSGTYYLKETEAPRGFRLSETVTPVTLSGGDATVNVADPPMDDPVNVLVQKKIEGMEPGEPIGDIPSLAGIRFRVDYYAGLYDSAEAAQASGPAKASAVFETNEQGKMQFWDMAPVDGTTWPYQDKQGGNTIPLGTVVITETATPPGMNVYGNRALTITDDGNGHEVMTQLEGWTERNGDEPVYDNPSGAVWKGSVTVVKADADSHSTEPQGDATLFGVEYTLVNRSKHPVVYNGQVIPVGEVVTTITGMPEDGKSVARAENLMLGTYEITETKPPEGYTLSGWTKTFSITGNGQNVSFTDANGPEDAVIRARYSLTKLDADTGLSKPQGDGTLEGAEFTIVNRSENAVCVNGTWYPPGAVVCTMVTQYDSEADAYMAEGPLLPYGTYEVTETKAPEGYDINPSISIVTIR